VSNLYYPQLTTGSLSQLPGRKQIMRRTIVNRPVNGSAVKMADPEVGQSRWSLRYTGLTDEEIGRLQDLFTACEGRLRNFVWLDPFANLLRWTDDLSKPVWQNSLQCAAGIEDPDGGTRAWRVTNAAQSGQGIAQSVDAPGWFCYAFGLWVRSNSTDVVELRLSNADGTVSAMRPVSADWQHVSVSGQIEGAAEEIRCSVEVPGACAVDVYGFQLDAQRDTSGYRKNTSVAGVYTGRFDQDDFEYVSHGPNNHATEIAVVTVLKAGT
jgi:hypothetical protein